MSVLGNASPQVLKNKGVPVAIHPVAKDEAGQWQRIGTGSDDDSGLVTVWLQITNDVLADIEERWGSLQDWQEALEKKPFSVVGTTIALVLGYWDGGNPDYKRAGKAMVDGGISDYANGIGVAVQLANGMDAVGAGEDLAAGKKAAAKARDEQARQVAEQRAKRDEESRTVQGEVVESGTPTLHPSDGAEGLPELTTGSTPGTTGSKDGASSADPLPSFGG